MKANKLAALQDGNTLDWALAYRELGLTPIPIPKGEKGPRFQNWPNTQYANDNEVRERFVRYEDANIGLLTGGLVVVDIDPRSGGEESFAKIVEESGPFPDTVEQKTGGGGVHFAFTQPPGMNIGNRNGLLPGIDIKANGGQIVAARSLHKSGNRYEWAEGKSPFERPIAPLPPSLYPLLQAKKVKRALDGSVGTRNDTLYKFACALRGAGADEAKITAEVFARNATFPEPLDAKEVLEIVKSSLKHPIGVPRYPANDSGNASQFVDEFGADIVSAGGTFFENRGGLWRPVADEVVEQRGRELSEKMLKEAKELPADTKEQEKVRKAVETHARRSGDTPRIKSMLRLVKGAEKVRRDLADFDRATGKLPVANGVVDLKSGDVEELKPEALLTKASGVAYNPKATAPKFRRLLADSLPDEHQEFVQRCLGYAICGVPREQVMFVLKGDGANGKSVLANVVGHVLGLLSARTDASTFLDIDRNVGAPRPDLMALQGKRVVVASEVPSRRRLDAVTIKRVTGGEPIVGRGLYQNEIVEFDVTFTILLLTNPYPGADETDSALWRRLVLIPFDRVVPEGQRNPRLADEIVTEEAEGVLAWLVEGARKYYAEGLGIPTSIRERTAEWRRQVGSIERYIREGLARNTTERELRFLHAEYASWARRNSLHPYGLEAFKTRITELGFRIDQRGAGEVVISSQVAA